MWRRGKAGATALALFLASCASGLCGEILFRSRFEPLGPNGLVTNEFAYWNPHSPAAVVSPDWELDSGSLFSKHGAGWTGVPDDQKPDPVSVSGNNSAVFRLTTKRKDFGDVEVSFRLFNRGLRSTPSTPEQPYDGVHVFLRYQSEFSLYYASVNRRENDIVIKKKVPGGSDNGGTYYELSSYLPYAVPYGKMQRIRAKVRNQQDGSVLIELSINGRRVLSAVDDGTKGGAPIRMAGKVGLRVDNAEVVFDKFEVSAL